MTLSRLALRGVAYSVVWGVYTQLHTSTVIGAKEKEEEEEKKNEEPFFCIKATCVRAYSTLRERERDKMKGKSSRRRESDEGYDRIVEIKSLLVLQ
jgi:hypothetical protein